VSPGLLGSRSLLAPSAVLIVDDESDHATIIQWVVTELAPALPVQMFLRPELLQHQLGSVPDGALLLLDRMINGRESLAMLPDLRSERPDLTVALMSAALSEADRARALVAGAGFAVEKPGHLAGWRALLGELLRPHDNPWSAAA
jgi:DNA-binding response OmpR family regulator